jgi:hypothetical protein
MVEMQINHLPAGWSAWDEPGVDDEVAAVPQAADVGPATVAVTPQPGRKQKVRSAKPGKQAKQTTKSRPNATILYGAQGKLKQRSVKAAQT